MTKHSIKMDPATTKFYQGAAAAARIHEEHAEVEWPDHDTRAAMFWFYAGVLAINEHGCESQEDIDHFLLGVATRKPRLEQIGESDD